jgi:hypothetical protein
VADRDAVVALLHAHDYRSTQVAERLAGRVRTASWPFLNLSLLIDVANAADEAFYSTVLQRAFGHISWHETPTLNTQVCKFALRHAEEFDPSDDLSLEPVFRLVALLLPVDQTYNLESPGVRVFRRLAERHPHYTVGLLVDAINDRIVWNQPFVWRLLADLSKSIVDIAPLRQRAKARLNAGDGGEVLHRELRRFLDSTGGMIP